MITIESSYGYITLDDDGNVIDRDFYSSVSADECYLTNVVKFDIQEYDTWYEASFLKPSPKPAHFDILALGYWNADGTHISASKEWRDYMVKG